MNKLMQPEKKYFRNSLSEIVYLRTYAGWQTQENRRETWPETVARYMDFMQQQLGSKLSSHLYSELHHAILQQEIMPSMRLMQFANHLAAENNVYAYNCAYIAPTTLEDFGEIMFVSLCGCGVGFSVESQNIQMLPIIKKQTGKKLKIYRLKNSKEAFCNTFVYALKTWFDGNDISFNFDACANFSAFQALLIFTRHKILASQGRRLTNLEVHDILCKIGETVRSHGVRRSALISLSDLNDDDMRHAKQGKFYYDEPQRAFSNNSAVYEAEPKDVVLLEEWLALMQSGCGERGLFNRESLLHTLPARRLHYLKQKKIIQNQKIVGMLGCNPCGEVILQSKQFCNLTEVIARAYDTAASLEEKIRLATILGTFQATLTHFQYLSNTWKRNASEEALLGVSITGIWDCGPVRDAKLLQQLKMIACRTNRNYAKKFGIHPSHAITCIKPSGTVSLLVDTASGIHPRYAQYYIRRIRIATDDPLSQLLIDQHVPCSPEIGYSLQNTPCYVFDFPIAAPKNAVTRDQLSVIDQLENWKLFKLNYTEHNPSVTIYVAEHEWIDALHWLKNHWNILGGLSFLPKDEATYPLSPFEKISQKAHQQKIKIYEKLDLSKIALYDKKMQKQFESPYDECSC